jgi:hypothetical protein
MPPEVSPDETVSAAPLGGTRAQAMQRLQIGLFGLASTVLMIGLAQIIMNQAREAEALVVPEAAPTVAPTQAAPTPASDPLADAGVGPDTPGERQQRQPRSSVTPSPDALPPPAN